MSDTYIHLRSARKTANLTQDAIANACGVSRNAVTQWESLNPLTRTEPSIRNLKIISSLTAIPISILVGQEIQAHDTRDSTKHVVPQTIPVLTWLQAESLDRLSHVNDIKPITKRVNLIVGSENVFALTVTDTSMTAPVGMEPSFPLGYLIHVDLEQAINNHDCVIARIKGQQQISFKQLRIDAGKQYLHSLDPSLPNIFDQFDLIGKVVAASIIL